MIEASAAIAAISISSMAERLCRAASTRHPTPAARASPLPRHIRRRERHAELPAPDDDALVVRQIDAGRDRITLAALEGAQAAEIDEHRIAEVGVLAQAGFRHQVDMERRARPDFAVRLEETGALVDRDPAAAPVDRIGGIRMDERAGGGEAGR